MIHPDRNLLGLELLLDRYLIRIISVAVLLMAASDLYHWINR